MKLKPGLNMATENTSLDFQQRSPSPVPVFSAAIIAVLKDKKGQATSMCLFFLSINLYVVI